MFANGWNHPDARFGGRAPGRDDPCELNRNHNVTFILLILLCTRFRCDDPEFMIGAMHSVLSSWDPQTYEQWRFLLNETQRTFSLNIADENAQTEFMSTFGLLKSQAAFGHACFAMKPTERECCTDGRGYHNLVWCQAHTPHVFKNGGGQPKKVRMHMPTHVPILAIGYFEQRWGPEWQCSLSNLKQQIDMYTKAYKQRHGASSEVIMNRQEYLLLQFVNFRNQDFTDLRELINKITEHFQPENVGTKKLLIEMLFDDTEGDPQCFNFRKDGWGVDSASFQLDAEQCIKNASDHIQRKFPPERWSQLLFCVV